MTSSPAATLDPKKTKKKPQARQLERRPAQALLLSDPTSAIAKRGAQPDPHRQEPPPPLGGGHDRIRRPPSRFTQEPPPPSKGRRGWIRHHRCRKGGKAGSAAQLAAVAAGREAGPDPTPSKKVRQGGRRCGDVGEWEHKGAATVHMRGREMRRLGLGWFLY